MRTRCRCFIVLEKKNKLHALLPALNTSRLNLRKHENLGPFSRRTDSVIVLLRPTPSKLKQCSGSIVLEVSIAFYHVVFYFFFFIIFYFLTNHNFTVMYSCIDSIIRFVHFSSFLLLISSSTFKES